MTRLDNRLPDSISDVSSSRMGVGQVGQRPPEQVRAAQLVVASTFMDRPDIPHPADVEWEIVTVLEALGIYNREARITVLNTRPPVGTRRQPSQRHLPRDHKFPGEREPNGRLSRRKDVAAEG